MYPTTQQNVASCFCAREPSATAGTISCVHLVLQLICAAVPDILGIAFTEGHKKFINPDLQFISGLIIGVTRKKDLRFYTCRVSFMAVDGLRMGMFYVSANCVRSTILVYHRHKATTTEAGNRTTEV